MLNITNLGAAGFMRMAKGLDEAAKKASKFKDATKGMFFEDITKTIQKFGGYSEEQLRVTSGAAGLEEDPLFSALSGILGTEKREGMATKIKGKKEELEIDRARRIQEQKNIDNLIEEAQREKELQKIKVENLGFIEQKIALDNQQFAAQQRADDQLKKQIDLLNAQKFALQNQKDALFEFREGSLMAMQTAHNLSNALGTTALQALASGASVKEAMKQELSAILIRISVQSAWQALLATGLGFFYMFTAPQLSTGYFMAAGALAAAAGASGAVGVSLGRSGSRGGSGAGSFGGSRSTSASGRPSFGKETKGEQVVNVNVYLGDPSNPASALLMQKQIQAQLKN
jgi:hypothetical protein